MGILNMYIICGLLVILIILSIACIIFEKAMQNNESRIDELTKELDKLNREITKDTQELIRLTKQRDEIKLEETKNENNCENT